MKLNSFYVEFRDGVFLNALNDPSHMVCGNTIPSQNYKNAAVFITSSIVTHELVF